MKILILYTYNKGYLSKFFFELSSKLQKHEHEVLNFSLKLEEKKFNRENISFIIKTRRGYWSNYFQIYNVIKKNKPDVIISNFSYVNPSLIFGRLLGVKKNIVWFHSLNNQINPNKIQICLKLLFLKFANLIVANSNLTKNELSKIYKVPFKKIVVLPFWTSINENLKYIEKSKKVKDNVSLRIGCPGRLTVDKNQELIIKTVSHLNKKGYSNFHLYFAGIGEELSNLEVITAKLNLSNKVTFLKLLSSDEMQNFYFEMDVIVLPSLDEAFGLVFIEAISLGRPALVSLKFGALTFVDDSEFNLKDFTFDPNSIDDLAQKLIPFFKKENLDSSYFKNLHDKTFDKNKIFQLINKKLMRFD